MSMDFLKNRMELLNQEFQNAKNNLATLTEQFEQAKLHFHKVSGHLQEAIYMQAESEKLQDESKEGGSEDGREMDSKNAHEERSAS